MMLAGTANVAIFMLLVVNAAITHIASKYTTRGNRNHGETKTDTSTRITLPTTANAGNQCTIFNESG